MAGDRPKARVDNCTLKEGHATNRRKENERIQKMATTGKYNKVALLWLLQKNS
jgi:hypothetical protein